MHSPETPLSVYPRKTLSHIRQKAHTRVLREIICKSLKSLEKPKCFSTEAINKLWYIHMMESYTIKMNEVQLYTTWMNKEHM